MLEIVGYLTLLAVVLQQLFFTVSADSSFSVSVGLAVIPFIALLVGRLGGHRVFMALFGVLTIFAIVSCVRFIGWGHRAFEPVADPNNYVTLLYLAFIPWMHLRLIDTNRIFDRTQSIEVGIAAVFTLAMLATHSRFAWLALLAAIAYWALLWKVHRLVNGPSLGACAIGFVVGFCLYSVSGQAEISSNIVSTVVDVGSASSRQTLIFTALSMIAEEGSWFGKGAFTFSLFFPMFRDVVDQVTNGIFVHNDYLQLLFEGGVFYVLPLLVLIGATGWKLLQGLLGKSADIGRLGYLLALGIALLHANFNFLFYILPIGIFMGVITGQAFQLTQGQNRAPARFDVLNPMLWRLTLIGMFVALAYLCLDAYSYGVFTRQPGMPGVGVVRSDAARMHRC